MNTIWVGSLGCLQIVLRMQSALVIQADAQASKITPRGNVLVEAVRERGRKLSLRAGHSGCLLLFHILAPHTRLWLLGSDPALMKSMAWHWMAKKRRSKSPSPCFLLLQCFSCTQLSPPAQGASLPLLHKLVAFAERKTGAACGGPGEAEKPDR